jgi:hypothetical protein
MKRAILLTVLLLVASHGAAAEIEVLEAAVATDIVERSPIGAGEVFPANVGKLYFYTKIKGGDGAYVTHRWYYKDTLVAVIPLELKYPLYRTYSWTDVSTEKKGEWRVEVAKEDGTVLKTLAFRVE